MVCAVVEMFHVLKSSTYAGFLKWGYPKMDDFIMENPI